MDLAARQQLNDLLAKLAQADAGAGQLGIGRHQAKHIALGRIALPAQQEIGAAEVEKREGMALADLGQIEQPPQLAGRKIHSAWAVPGGVRSPLSAIARDWILERLPEARATAAAALELYKKLLDGPLQREQLTFGDFPSLFMGLVTPDGGWECIEGAIRFIDSHGRIVADGLSEDDYASFLGEAVESWSYLKFPYYKPLGYPEGMYRVGPLARLNVCERIGTAWADAELAELRQRSGTPGSGGRIITSSFAYHHARLVEIVACLEGIEQLVADDALMGGRIRAHASLNANGAVGVSEAPRGTLFHHYRVNDDGLITRVNLIIATGQNNLAMNRTVAQIAREFIPTPVAAGAEIPEPLLNRVEAGIRCFDPCLSCSTHAAGQMPLRIELVDAAGRVLAERVRD